MSEPPIYTRETDQPLFATTVESRRDDLDRGDIELWQGDECWSVIRGATASDYGHKSEAQIIFGARRFSLTQPDDRSFTESLQEFFNPHHRRRVWRAGSGVATEIRDASTDDQDLKGWFDRDGLSYSVESKFKTFPAGRLKEPARILCERREVARIEYSIDSHKQLFITPSRPVRLDVLAIGFHLSAWLFIQRRGGAGGVGGAGGGGGGDGGGC